MLKKCWRRVACNRSGRDDDGHLWENVRLAIVWSSKVSRTVEMARNFLFGTVLCCTASCVWKPCARLVFHLHSCSRELRGERRKRLTRLRDPGQIKRRRPQAAFSREPPLADFIWKIYSQRQKRGHIWLRIIIIFNTGSIFLNYYWKVKGKWNAAVSCRRFARLIASPVALTFCLVHFQFLPAVPCPTGSLEP